MYDFQSKKDSQMTLTQSSYTSTQQSQLDTTEAVYPDLTSCSVSVDKILPQLTSSLWYVHSINRITAVFKVKTDIANISMSLINLCMRVTN